MKRSFIYASALALSTVVAPFAQSVSDTINLGLSVVPEAKAANFRIQGGKNWQNRPEARDCRMLYLRNGNVMSRNHYTTILTTTRDKCPDGIWPGKTWLAVTVDRTDPNTVIFNDSGYRCTVEPNGTCKGQ